MGNDKMKNGVNVQNDGGVMTKGAIAGLVYNGLIYNGVHQQGC